MILPLPTESTRISHRWTRKQNNSCQCLVLTRDWHLLIQYILREDCTISEFISAGTSAIPEHCITTRLLPTTWSGDGIKCYNCRLHKTAANQIGAESSFGIVLPGAIWDQVEAISQDSWTAYLLISYHRREIQSNCQAWGKGFYRESCFTA